MKKKPQKSNSFIVKMNNEFGKEMLVKEIESVFRGESYSIDLRVSTLKLDIFSTSKLVDEQLFHIRQYSSKLNQLLLTDKTGNYRYSRDALDSIGKVKVDLKFMNLVLIFQGYDSELNKGALLTNCELKLLLPLQLKATQLLSQSYLNENRDVRKVLTAILMKHEDQYHQIREFGITNRLLKIVEGKLHLNVSLDEIIMEYKNNFKPHLLQFSEIDEETDNLIDLKDLTGFEGGIIITKNKDKS